jgi:hypothetical protein
LLVVEQAVAPLDRAAQRAMARGDVACPAGEELQSLIQSTEHRLGREDPDAGGGKLDAEWQPVESQADLGDAVQFLLRGSEARPDRPGSIEEEHNRFVSADICLR